MGKKKKPIYKIVAADSRAPRDGRFIEAVGFYNPNQDPMEIKLKDERVIYWLRNGAQPTNTVKSLIVREGLMLRWNLTKKGKDENSIQEELNKFNAGKDERIARDKARKERRKVNKAKKAAEAKSEAAPAS
jgi:small subunit ribosomal protein S16